MRVAVRMRSRVGAHDSAACEDEILGVPHERALVPARDGVKISFQVPVRVVGVLVDGSAPARARARAPHGDWFALPCEPLAELGGVKLQRTTLLASELELVAPDAEKIEIHLDYEVHALHDFARVYGLDFQALAYGRESFDTFHGYRILGARVEDQPERIRAVAISRPAGRFGNHLMQLVQATHVARELGVETIYTPPIPWFEVGQEATSAHDLTYVGYSDLDEIAITSLFGTFLFEDLEPAASMLDGYLRQRLVDRYVSSLFAPPPLQEPRPASHVAVHVRSGDLFDRPNPHPNFVQPPLAFYKRALTHFMEGRDDVHVTLVYEDVGNPVIAELHSFLTSADLTVLLEHRALILGRGSFGVAVAALSPNVETLYFPWSESRFPGLVRERGLEGYLIEEIVPRYIEAGAWTNSEEQRRLMIGYFADNLRVEELQ